MCEIFALPHPLWHDHPLIFGLCQKNLALASLAPPPPPRIYTLAESTEQTNYRVACGITHNVVIRFMYVYVLKRKHVTLVETKNTWNACSYK